MNILIVEDHAPVRRMLCSLVKPFTENIFECADGGQAFAVYERHRPDWTLMDVAMPQTDGISATRQITNVFPAARIVIVTSYDDAYLREAAKAAGACGYVCKENLHLLRSLLTSCGGS